MAINTIIGIPDIITLGGIIDFVFTLQSANIKFRLQVTPLSTLLIFCPSPPTTTMLTMDMAHAFKKLPLAAPASTTANEPSHAPSSQSSK